MTAFNYLLQKDLVIVAMDTLVSDSIDKRPLKLISKIHLISHANCLICGTGSLEAIQSWLNWVENHNITNIIDLNILAKKDINRLLFRYNKYGTTTVYQFGYDEKHSEFIGYAYRSTNNYQFEKLQYGIGVKPDAGIKGDKKELSIEMLNKFKSDSMEEFFYKIMKEQKLYDDKLPVNEKVGIGGRCQVIILSKNKYELINYKKFADYQKTFDAINSSLL